MSEDLPTGAFEMTSEELRQALKRTRAEVTGILSVLTSMQTSQLRTLDRLLDIYPHDEVLRSAFENSKQAHEMLTVVLDMRRDSQ